MYKLVDIVPETTFTMCRSGWKGKQLAGIFSFFCEAQKNKVRHGEFGIFSPKTSSRQHCED